jgi:mRNA-degrading endonuclease toxin of MazEF toxin-antitoxin module
VNTPLPGEVYYSAHTAGGERHRLIVVSSEKFNQGRYVTVVPTTSSHFHDRSRARNCIAFVSGAYGCFTKNCVAQCEQIATVRKEELDWISGSLGTVGPAQMNELRVAIGYVVGVDCAVPLTPAT